MNFFDTVGKMAIGSRLRLLTDKITEDAGRIYGMYGIDMHPKWFPVFYVLSNGGAMTIGSIAKEIGHSHPSVSKIIGEMVKKGLVKEKDLSSSDWKHLTSELRSEFYDTRTKLAESAEEK